MALIQQTRVKIEYLHTAYVVVLVGTVTYTNFFRVRVNHESEILVGQFFAHVTTGTVPGTGTRYDGHTQSSSQPINVQCCWKKHVRLFSVFRRTWINGLRRHGTGTENIEECKYRSVLIAKNLTGHESKCFFFRQKKKKSKTSHIVFVSTQKAGNTFFFAGTERNKNNKNQRTQDDIGEIKDDFFISRFFPWLE